MGPLDFPPRPATPQEGRAGVLWPDRWRHIQGVILSNVKIRGLKLRKDTEEAYMHITKRKSPSDKATDGVIPATWHPGKGKITETVKG